MFIMQDWEAVVLIPFIDEKLLLKAMKPCNEKLTKEERERNTHGPMYIYTYSPDNLGEYLVSHLRLTFPYWDIIISIYTSCVPNLLQFLTDWDELP